MSALITLLGLFFLIAAFVGVISPKTVLGKWSDKFTRFQTFMLFIFLFIFCVVGGSQLSHRDYEDRKRKEESELSEKKKTQPTPQPATKPEQANITPPKAAAAPKPVEKPRPQAATQENPKGISVSYDQVMADLSKLFKMEKNILADGRLRYSGNTPNYLSLLEIIGDKTNIDSATLIIATPKDSELRQQNVAIASVFIKNTMPEIKDRNIWITQSLKKVGESGKDEFSEDVGAKKITIKYTDTLGIMFVVNHK